MTEKSIVTAHGKSSVQGARDGERARRLDWEHVTSLAERVLAGDRDDWNAFWDAVVPTVTAWVDRLPYFRRTGQRDDHCRDVVMDSWEKLQRRDYDALRRFFTGDKARALLAANGPEARADYFRAWLRVVVRRVAQDHLRAIPEYVQRRLSRSGGPADLDATSEISVQRWRVVESLTTGTAARSQGAELKLFADRALAFLDAAVDDRERRAVALRAQGRSAASIARALDLADPARAERFVRHASARVHYRAALELWCAGFSPAEIADRLALADAAHAARIVKAAKAVLRRQFAVSAASTPVDGSAR